MGFSTSRISGSIDQDSVYNLKRRIASLPPISEEVFENQVLTLEAGNDENETTPQFRQVCAACEQQYTNRKAWNAHLKSRNHTQKITKLDSKGPILSDDGPSTSVPLSNTHDENEPEDEAEKFSSFQCLFCNAESTSLDSNLSHMSQAHSFFIPDAEYLLDVESFLSYLFVIISIFNECIFCGSIRSTKLGVQDHMRGKGHCKLDFEDNEHELEQFYEFSGESEEDENENGGESGKNIIVVPDGDELRLPSGKTLGHRTRVRRVRQKHADPSSSGSPTQQRLLTQLETEAVPPESKDRRITVRPGTSTSMIGVSELQQRALIAVEQKIMKIETRAKNEYQARVDKGGNKQKFYKVSSIGKKAGGLEKRLG